MRPIQIWVPDTRAKKFADECRKQSQLAASHDENNPSLDHLLADSIDDIDGWDS